MTCHVPKEYRAFRWHIIQGHHGHRNAFEIAEWINDARNGPTEKGHWVRWGYAGDFPSLCQADYIGPIQDAGLILKLWQSEQTPKQAPTVTNIIS